VSLTDARVLGVPGMIRESGDVAGTPGCKLVGPAGEIDLAEGVMVAKRHIHMTPEDAAAFGVADKEVVKVRVESERSAELDDVIVRVSPKYALAMHIDTDESNATCAFGTIYGTVIKK
jgi:putative phosphotransacetylase